VKFSALALDYDGTIAQHDVLDSSVRAAINELRAQGITVMLVTGRILSDLQRVAGDLAFVDAIVAENGAVIYFPDSGYTTTVGTPPFPSLLDALRQDGIAFDAGHVIVEAGASDAPRILATVQRLELPLSLLFNRSRVMVLPQAISKATGLRQALTTLRLSTHNTVGIGDAENDHELLQTCEVGLAVEWGSEALKAAADFVLPGTGPAAVADYVRTLANRRRVPTPLKTRRRLLLGNTETGEPLALAVRGRNVLVAGDPKSGKSWVAGLLCEQLILYGYCLCILDPEGDYVSLEALPGVVVFGGSDPLPRPRDVMKALRHPDVSVVVDLSHASQSAKVDYLRNMLPVLSVLRRETGLPHRIVVDEAHYFLHDEDVLDLLDLELNGYTMVTYRASRLHPDILAASETILVTQESDPGEVRALATLCRPCRALHPEEWERQLRQLKVGEAMVLPVTAEAEGEARLIRLAPRLTPHVRHLAKYVDVSVPAGRAFVFWRNGGPPDRRARTLREFVDIVDETPTPALDGHLRRGDFSRWVADVFGDYSLSEELQRMEREYRAGALAAAGESISHAIRSRYDLIEEHI
jgi:phosphoserine phosphatase